MALVERHPALARPAARPADLLAALAARWARWREYRRTRAALAALSDRELKDIGHVRAEIPALARQAAGL